MSTEQPSTQCITIDVNALLEHGNTPTAIILTVTIFTFVLFRSLKQLIHPKEN